MVGNTAVPMEPETSGATTYSKSKQASNKMGMKRFQLVKDVVQNGTQTNTKKWVAAATRNLCVTYQQAIELRYVKHPRNHRIWQYTTPNLVFLLLFCLHVLNDEMMIMTLVSH